MKKEVSKTSLQNDVQEAQAQEPELIAGPEASSSEVPVVGTCSKPRWKTPRMSCPPKRQLPVTRHGPSASAPTRRVVELNKQASNRSCPSNQPAQASDEMNEYENECWTANI